MPEPDVSTLTGSDPGWAHSIELGVNELNANLGWALNRGARGVSGGFSDIVDFSDGITRNLSKLGASIGALGTLGAALGLRKASKLSEFGDRLTRGSQTAQRQLDQVRQGVTRRVEQGFDLNDPDIPTVDEVLRRPTSILDEDDEDEAPPRRTPPAQRQQQRPNRPRRGGNPYRRVD